MMHTIAIAMAVVVLASPAFADQLPPWIKTTAGWWADDLTTDAEFVGAMQYLIQNNIITVEAATPVEPTSPQEIPPWIKTTAGWWVDDLTTDAEFVGAMQYLIDLGIIHVQGDSYLAQLQIELEACAQHTKLAKKLDCEKDVKDAITRYKYETESTPYVVGPVTYYYPGAHLEFTNSGQALLTVQMLAVNNDDSNITLMCTGPAICNYDVTDGSNAYKYASTDFISGSITIKPGEAREFEILFGPNIGYGGTQFIYDPAKTYHFRISEGFGSASILLDLD